METIFALSSGAVPAAVAIVRVSGPAVRFGLETIIGTMPEPRKARLCDLCDVDGTIIDRALVLFFPGPRSFTGEDCVEYHLHGGRAVVAAMMRRLASLDGYRSAEPGEFTRRAFENGRVDLTEVEGLADLILADTEMQRRQAFDQSAGALSGLYEGWRRLMVRARAMIEAEFDFADEDDIPGSVADTIWDDLSELALQIKAHLEGGKAGEIIREGYRIVILGAPNAGKSSLLNTLARRDIAIVSDEFGTTRDVLELHLDIGGYPVVVFDTAGLRDSAGAVEKEGIRRALTAARGADLILALEDVADPVSVDIPDVGHGRILNVGTKADLVPPVKNEIYDCRISVVDQTGIESLIDQIRLRVENAVGSVSTSLPSRQRHQEYLEKCLLHLHLAIDGVGIPLELRAEELRQSCDMLGRLTGRVDVEDLLDVIFKEFCVGK